MKLGLLEALPDVPLIDIAGGYTGPYSGAVPEFLFHSEKSCDFFVSPHDLYDINSKREYITYLVAKSKERPTIIFNRGDFPGDIGSDSFFYVQNSVEVGGMTHNRIIVPYNIKSIGTFQPRPLKDTPVFCFVGYVPKFSLGRIGRSLYPHFHPITKNSALIRRLLLMNVNLHYSQNIIQRNSFYGGSAKLPVDDPARHRSTYLDSLNNCDISLCPRGDANASQRFYETLAAGRIPLVPDSNSFFPSVFSNAKMHQIFVKPSSFNLISKVEELWRGMNNFKYQEIQLDNFNYFENFVRYDKFMKDLFALTLSDFLRHVLR